MASHPSRGGPPDRRNPLVAQWAELLSALDEGSPSISTSADQMAEDLPGDLVEPVNAELRQRGCSYQVSAPARPGHKGSSKRRLVERGKARPGGRDAA